MPETNEWSKLIRVNRLGVRISLGSERFHLVKQWLTCRETLYDVFTNNKGEIYIDNILRHDSRQRGNVESD